MAALNSRANEIVLAALEIDAPEARRAYLENVCSGDVELRRQVEALLKTHERAGRVLEQPADPTCTDENRPNLDPTLVPVAATEPPGERIGPYRLLQKLGEGGMGTVWVAEQSEPVSRRVALKLIKAGMDSSQVLRRFEAERQALALMDHQNIAKVLDAGATPQGRPYFAMELIKGIPITKYCDQQHLTPRERLELFIPVCQAVQHAHQKGIIHRDLKPSNVLIALYDGKPVPKVIDFGVAKATSQKLTERTMYTEVGQILGTLEYMAPEQAEVNNLDIDTRADIYSLGVILYELLAGSPPFTTKQLHEAAFSEMLRLIREVEPQKPSTRLSSSDELPSIAANRKLEPSRLTRIVHGDLDWIVMKSLEKDRARRYETANGLARDVERFLANQVVEARPPSTGYRVRKFVSRHKGQVVAAGLVFLTLLAGIAGTALGLLRAREQKQFAQLAQQQAEQRLAQLERGNELLAGIFTDLNVRRMKEIGRPLEAELGERLAKAADRLEGESVGDPLTVATLQWQMGKSLNTLGHSGPAARLLEKSLQTRRDKLGSDHPDTLSSMNELANSYGQLGRLADAQTLYEEALAKSKVTLGPDHPSTLTFMKNLANSYYDLGRRQEALKLFEDTLALRKAKLGSDDPETASSMSDLAIAYATAGRLQEAVKLFAQSLELRRTKLGPAHIDTLMSMNNLAYCYTLMGRHQEALQLFEETLKQQKATLGPDNPETLRSMGNLAESYYQLNRHPEALKLLTETLALRKSKLGPDHPETLVNMNLLAKTNAALGRNQEALSLFRDTLALRTSKLGSDHPDTLETVHGVATCLEKLGRPQEALPVLDAALTASASQEADPSRAALILRLRFKACQFRSDLAGASRAVERLTALDHSDADSLYNLACCTSRLAAMERSADPSADGAKRAEAEAARAMALLTQARNAGYRNAANMAVDTDLAPLQNREDFKRLLAELARPATK
jgi:serine/threonine protein kinase/tetratricopeptide (TPR) repeat protein